MLGLVLLVLIICALVAIIFGRQTAQKLFGCFVSTAVVMVVAIVTIAIRLGQQTYSSTTPAAISSPPMTVNPVTNAPLVNPVQPPTSLYLGIDWEPLNQQNGAKYGLAPGVGLFVHGVHSGSPAEFAGISPGDYISKADGQWLTADFTIANAISAHRDGDNIVLTLLRDGNEFNLNVRLATRY